MNYDEYKLAFFMFYTGIFHAKIALYQRYGAMLLQVDTSFARILLSVSCYSLIAVWWQQHTKKPVVESN